MATLDSLTDDQIMEVYDILSQANPDLIKLAGVRTGLAATQAKALSDAEIAYNQELQSPTPVNIGSLEVTLENAENAFFFSFTNVFTPEQAQSVYAQTQNITQGLHPETGQEMEYKEIAGKQYFVPVTATLTADNASPAGAELPLQASFVPATQSSVTKQPEAIVEDIVAAPTKPSADKITSTPAQTAATTLADMSPVEIEEAIALASTTGGGDYETYKTAFIAMNPEFQGFFNGIDAQTSALGINPLSEQLTEGLNTNPTVAANLILIGRDSTKLEALTTMVTEDNDPMTFLRDEAEVSRLIHSFAQSAGNAPLAPQIEIQPLMDLANTQVTAIEAGNIDEAPSWKPIEAPLQPPSVAPIVPQLDTLPPARFQGASAQTGQIPNTLPDFSNAVVITVEAPVNVNAEPSFQNHSIQAGEDLDSILQAHYGIEAGGMSYRASLIIAQANGIDNPNMISPGDNIKIPSLSSLQELAGDNIGLQNLDRHPAELGQQLKEMMNSDTAPSSQMGAAYGFPSQAAAAPSV